MPLYIYFRQKPDVFLKVAGAERIELPSKVLETPMLPLYHAPRYNLPTN